MRKIIKGVISHLWLIVQLLIIFIIPIEVYQMNLSEIFIAKLELSVENIFLYVLLEHGDVGIAILTAVALWRFICIFNSKRIFNKNNVYNNYSYLWYIVFGKGLGFKKCSLVGVPIYLQFKLVMNDLFMEYEFGDIFEDEIEIGCKVFNEEQNTEEINVVVADTYPIKKVQIPDNKVQLYTIKVSRKNGNDTNRYICPELAKKIVSHLRKMKTIKRVNIFMTTNPKNTYCIIDQAFKLHGRGNIKSIFVYQQSDQGERKFLDRGICVYKV